MLSIKKTERTGRSQEAELDAVKMRKRANERVKSNGTAHECDCSGEKR